MKMFYLMVSAFVSFPVAELEWTLCLQVHRRDFCRNTKIVFLKLACYHAFVAFSMQADLDILKNKVKTAAWDSISSFYTLVFLSGLWERMINDTEGSTSRSLKLQERYDLSLWLTCAISLHTYSNSWLNPSLFPDRFSHQSAFAFSPFWSISQDKDLLFIQRSHLDGTLEVWEQRGLESRDDVCTENSTRWEHGNHHELETKKNQQLMVRILAGAWGTGRDLTVAQGLIFHLESWLSAGFHSWCHTSPYSTVLIGSFYPFKPRRVDVQELWISV